MMKTICSVLLVSAAMATAAEISPALKSLQGRWNGERVNSEGRRNKAILEIKDDKLEYRAFDSDGTVRFIARGNLRIEKAGDLRALSITDIRAGRDEGNLELVDDDRTSVYTIREDKLYLASGFDKPRDNERPRVEEFTKEEGAARSGTDKATPTNNKLLGKWKMEAVLGDNTLDYELRFEQSGGTIQGVVISPRSGEYKAKSVTLKGDQFEMLVDRSIEGNDVTFVYKGSLKGDTLSGTLQVKGLEDQFSGSFKATR